MTDKVQIMRNAGANGVSCVWNILVWLGLFPFIVGQLGLETTGLWLMVSAMVAYFPIVMQGFRNSQIRFVAHYKAQGHQQKVAETFTAALCLFGLAGIVAVVTMAWIGRSWPPWFELPVNIRDEVAPLTLMVGITALIGLPLEAIGNVYRGFQRLDALAGIEIVASLLRVIAVVGILLMGQSVVALAVCSLVEVVIRAILCVTMSRRFLGAGILRLVLPTRARWAEYFRLAMPLSLSAVGPTVVAKTQLLVVGALLSVSIVAFLEAAMRIAGALARVLEVAASAAFPAASSFNARHEEHAMRLLYLRGTKYAYAAMLPLAVPTIVFAHQLMGAWMGEAFAAYGGLVIVLIGTVIVRAHHAMMLPLLKGAHHPWPLVVFQLSIMLAAVGFTVLLVRPLGVYAAAVGALVPYLILEWPFLTRCFQLFQLDWNVFVQRVYARLWIPLCVVSGVMLVARWSFDPTTLLSLMWVYCGSFVIFACLFWSFGLESFEQAEVRRGVSQAWSSVVAAPSRASVSGGKHDTV